MKINTEVMNKEIKFKIGQEFTENTPSGKTIRSTISQQGDKLVQKQIFEDGFIATVEYTFTPEGAQLVRILHLQCAEAPSSSTVTLCNVSFINLPFCDFVELQVGWWKCAANLQTVVRNRSTSSSIDQVMSRKDLFLLEDKILTCAGLVVYSCSSRNNKAKNEVMMDCAMEKYVYHCR